MGDLGVFGVARSIFDHPLLKGKEFDPITAMVWLVSETAWKPRRVYLGGQWIALERGQTAHSLRFMARKWKWSVKMVRGFLDRLAADGTILLGSKKGTATSRQVTVITLCNYNTYQTVALPKETAKGTARAQQGHKEEEGNTLNTELAAETRIDFRVRAEELTEHIRIIFGFDDALPTGWRNLPDLVETGLRSGWKSDLVRLAARELAARRRANIPASCNYLTKIIDDAHAKAAAPSKEKPLDDHQQRELVLFRHFEGKRRGQSGGVADLAMEAFERAAEADRQNSGR